MRKVKLFFFCPSLAAGGLERVLSVLSKPMAEHYDEVTYITWHNKPVFYEIDNRVKIVSVEKECRSDSFLKMILWFNKYVLSNKPDLLISFSTPFNMIALTALAGSGIKVVVAERNDPAHFRWGWFAKQIRDLLYRTADGILVQTETCKNHLGNRLAKKVNIIPNPILMDTKYIGCALNSEKERTIVTVSRLVPQKRLDLLIKTFYQFHASRPEYRLVIYGDGDKRDELQMLINDCHLEKSVSMPGAVGDVWEKIKRAVIFVMTSEYEGMSNALLEAICLGLPCISTKVSGAIEVIKDGENGLLIDVNDEKELLEAMEMLAENSSLRVKIGKNAIAVFEKYGVENIIRQWCEYVDFKLEEG